MKRRIIGGALVAVLAVATLSACRTNVGYAATVDGKRYTETDITDYLTPDAEAVSEQGADGSSIDVPSRSFVVETLIVDRLFDRVLSGLPGGGPSSAQLDQIKQQGLNGSSEAKVARSAGIRGYTGDFAKIWVRTRVAQQFLQQAQQQGLDIRAVITGLKFPVSVNPRYGTWEPKTFSLDSSAGAGAPAFLKLQEASSGGDALPSGS